MKHLFPVGEEIGRGFEKEVYDKEGDDKKVVGEFHWEESANEKLVPARYWLNKILHYFHSEIPEMYLSSSNPQTVIMEKVNLAPTHIQANSLDKKAIKTQNFNVLKYAGPFVKKLHQDFGILIDDSIWNFSIDSNNDVKYVDTIDPFDANQPIQLNFDIKKIRAKIATVESEKDREKLSGWADRLEGLANIA